MLLDFSLYDLLYLTFVQLLLSTVLVLSPARSIGSRFRWTGSRITEVIVGGVGAAAISAAAVGITRAVWGLPVAGLGTGAYLLVVVSVVVIALRPGCGLVGQVFYASYAAAAVVFLAYAAFIAFVATRTIPEMVTSSLVIVLDLAAFVVLMSAINHASDVLSRVRRGRPLPVADPGYQPFVSLHIPAYNEPPELLIETIKAVEAIDYPNFEVVVIDNNTRDPAVWRPVEDYCRGRERVTFVHVAPWPGYKAGACNLALRRYTDPRAEIIGLVDADDIVQPHYLRETVAYFSNPDLGFVQTFEGNRDFEGSDYYTACVDSFQAFYLGTMSSRNERDSVPFVGTMGLFRRSALTAIGGWNEWCICEDTEASLRVLKDGWSGLYLPRCFGRGIVPPSFAGMLTQRHRWCFGGMQIMRLHWRSLMPWDHSPDNHLTFAQRRDYLMASLSWFRDLLMLAFSLLLLVIAGLSVTNSGFFVAPMDGARSVLPVSLIIIATICMVFSLRYWTALSYRRALLSLVISLSVAFVIARGCIEGMARRDAVFLRTSKVGGRRTAFTAVKLVRWETALAVALYVSAGFIANLRHPPLLLLIIIVVQATVYLCAPVASVWNLWAQGVPGHEYRRRFAERRLRAERRRRKAWAPLPRSAAAALTAFAVGGVASVYVAPASLLHATTTTTQGTVSLRSLLAASGTGVYLELGSPDSPAGRAYYPVTGARLSDQTLSFGTASLPLLSEILQAGTDGGGISHIGLAFRVPGPGGLPATEQVNTFATAVVTSFQENLSGIPGGNISLKLPATSNVTGTPGAVRYADPTGVTTSYVTLGAPGGGGPAYAATAVGISQASSHAPIDLSFTTSAPPLLDTMFQAEGAATDIPVLTLSVHGGGGSRLTHTFSRLSVSSFAENLSGPLSGSATLVIPRGSGTPGAGA